ncbi:MAG: hypothetical protein HY866_01915 [Chloroflexi bacterium]|nr:hypothetical protein [Chloroflexota bacterium]
MAHRASNHTSTDTNYPQYEWSLDTAGHPVHITQAQPHDVFVCPVCKGRMIAKLGEIKQHHFAHESLKICTPESVTAAAAGLWLADQLRDCLNTRRSVTLSWNCPLCQQPHTTDLMHGVTNIKCQIEDQENFFDVVLLGSNGKIVTVMLFRKPSDKLVAWSVEHSAALIVVDIGRRHTAHFDLAEILKGASFYGGPCETQRTAAEQGVITDLDTLRDTLVRMVSYPPYRICGTLDNLGTLSNVLTLADQKLWMPPILWRRAIGGLHHTISPTLQITSQEWKQPDGGTIALYYVIAGLTAAVAVRRFPPGEMPYARLDTAAFRSDRVTAATVARSFVEL